MYPKIEQTEHHWLQNVLTGVFLRSDLLATDDPKREAKAEHLATRTVQEFIRQRRHFTLDEIQGVFRDNSYASSESMKSMFRTALFESPFAGGMKSELVLKCTALLLKELPALKRPSLEEMQTLLPPTRQLEIPLPEHEQPVQSELGDKPVTYTRGQVQHAIYHFFLHERPLHGDIAKTSSLALQARYPTPAAKDRALGLTAKVMDNLTFENREGAEFIVDGLKNMQDTLTKQIREVIHADPTWPKMALTTPEGIARGIARHLGTSTQPFLMQAKSVSATAIMELNQNVKALRAALAAQDEGRGAA